MSKRRKPGDWVWLKPCSGFVGESNRLKAQIQIEDYETQYGPDDCMVFCDDPECKEWATLFTEPDPLEDGK